MDSGPTGATKHEIVLPILTKFELGNIVAHHLTVMHKIDTHVGNHPAICLATQDEAGFQQAIRHVIAMHTTDEDCHELLDYICSVAKLRKC
jgi:ABC-type cobalamin transport system ATPase subunit